jgi:hypothetical protein
MVLGIPIATVPGAYGLGYLLSSLRLSAFGSKPTSCFYANASNKNKPRRSPAGNAKGASSKE